ncbi:MAG: hypothetical protein ABFC77_14610 [Thermoguttaceae bacterium]
MSIKTRLKNLEAAARAKQEAERLNGRDYLEVIAERLVAAGLSEAPRDRFQREHREAEAGKTANT